MVVVAILSLMTWIAIGILLYALDREFREADQTRSKELGQSYGQDYGLFGALIDLFRMGQQGIRVSIGMEAKGGDPTVIP